MDMQQKKAGKNRYFWACLFWHFFDSPQAPRQNAEIPLLVHLKQPCTVCDTSSYTVGDSKVRAIQTGFKMVQKFFSFAIASCRAMIYIQYSFERKNTFEKYAFERKNTFEKYSFGRKNTFEKYSFERKNTFEKYAFERKNTFEKYAFEISIWILLKEKIHLKSMLLKLAFGYENIWIYVIQILGQERHK